ncbi:transglycosylase SLT domain-containing protein [Thiorhodovibrio frisius]|uniref:Putative soluble lytic transglycosylase fused to an ABC-type amino acid-binding protein n=1 Tax=Thiorhodovibrio frisius TaxID=631362 RepID=H8Z057_9GAMM|nr:transglycosylase SLT domain-containing protein [Thiorhodovibrio frisius]EIC22265.1 putative soluble lytic transglycosylase fused to an ABC-type amino acid-binding protein [Thiorhodovibrio frisius]WPL24560.1 Soluble lytic murein transglycosylase precursor [Thiorhodovibrio frisius]
MSGRGFGFWARSLAPALALVLVPTLAFAAAGLGHVGHARWTDNYDADFRKYSKRYFGPGFDWRWFKAQAIAESRLRPGAYNPSGATGLMQILPSTFKEIQGDNPAFTNLHDPRWNIAAGIFYNRYLFERWRKRIGHGDEHLLYTFASYNAGFGRVSKAYRRAGGKAGKVLPWRQLAPYVPEETREYVKKIQRLMHPAFDLQANLDQRGLIQKDAGRLSLPAGRANPRSS